MGYESEMLFKSQLKKAQVTLEEIGEARLNLVASVMDFVTAKYPNIALDVLERNLSQFCEMKKYYDACPMCVSVGQCPSRDGNRLNGRLEADGVVRIWMEPCPQGLKRPKRASKDDQPEDDWRERSRKRGSKPDY